MSYRVVIGNKEIKLIGSNVTIAKRMISDLLEKSKKEAEAVNNASFYYTMLVIMYTMSEDHIRTLTPEVLSLILNAAAEGESRNTK